MPFWWAGIWDSLNTWHTLFGYVVHLTGYGGCVKSGGYRDRVRDTMGQEGRKATGNRTESVKVASAFGGARRSMAFQNTPRLCDIRGSKPGIVRRG